MHIENYTEEKQRTINHHAKLVKLIREVTFPNKLMKIIRSIQRWVAIIILNRFARSIIMPGNMKVNKESVFAYADE